MATLLLRNVGRRRVCGHIGALHAYSVSPFKSHRERGGYGREKKEKEEEKKEREEIRRER
jgi:hypothetical protein